jgi:hypothetical protein
MQMASNMLQWSGTLDPLQGTITDLSINLKDISENLFFLYERIVHASFLASVVRKTTLDSQIKKKSGRPDSNTDTRVQLENTGTALPMVRQGRPRRAPISRKSPAAYNPDAQHIVFQVSDVIKQEKKLKHAYKIAVQTAYRGGVWPYLAAVTEYLINPTDTTRDRVNVTRSKIRNVSEEKLAFPEGLVPDVITDPVTGELIQLDSWRDYTKGTGATETQSNVHITASPPITSGLIELNDLKSTLFGKKSDE